MSFSFRQILKPVAAALLLPLAAAVPSSRPLQGAQPDPQVIAQFGLYNSPALQAYITRQGKAMTAISDRPGDYGFTIVDSPVINAFATPDGHVYFTRGIMAYFNDEAQFTGVLGHELGHITARHGQKQQTRSTISSILLGVGSAVSPNLIGRFAQPLSQVAGLGLLKYGRDAENEADQLGVKYSTKTGYDASHMASFFQTLERTEAQSGSSIPTFLSTHPNSADRYERVKALAAQARQSLGKTTLKVNRDSYLRSIDGLLFGDDPRQGYVASNVFYHPELKFSLPVPSGWKTDNTPAQFQMAEPSGKALLVFLGAPAGTAEASAQSVVKQLGLTGTQAQNTTINSFPAVIFEGDQSASSSSSSSTPAHVRGYLIKDGNSNYALVGLASAASFSSYSPQFDNVAQGFRRLTDASRLNKQPQRISIRQVKSATTLRQALTANGVASGQLDDMAILNGMQLGDQLAAGTLFKVVK